MANELSELKAPVGANRRAKHTGRGMGSGNGKTAGRGMKGQKARKSGHVRPGFEGGQMPLQRRLPKRGFHNLFAKNFYEIQVSQLGQFEGGSEINIDLLREAGLVRGKNDGVKIIGKGGLDAKVNVKVHRISKGARETIEAAGGAVDLIPDRPKWLRTDSRQARRAQVQK